ncbi:MAG: histidine kinase, partial [Clostridiales bacterium]|nr:histidine kinase [Clostridiales bacterium]
MKKFKLRLHFRSKLMLIQFFLVLPLLTIALFVTAYLIRTSALSEIDSSRMYSLQTVGGAFDRIYSRVKRLLEVPYTNRAVYEIISRKYGPSDALAKSSDYTEVQNALYREVLYYEPNITSIVIVSETSDAMYYNRQGPTKTVNMHNPEWYTPTQSRWYKEAAAGDDPIIAIAEEDELFLGSGITLAFSQRLREVGSNRHIGAIRIDLSLNTLTRDWESIAENESDIFAVLDTAGALVFTNSAEFLSQHPLFSVPDVSALNNGYRLARYSAPVSKFTFLYFSHLSSSPVNSRLLWGVPLLFAALGFLYSALFIGWSSQYISLPIKKLKTVMRQGQQKDLTVRCEPLAGEMGELSEAFNGLMNRMGELVTEVAEREHEKSQLSYEVLRSKISPHFLYNTINAIRWKADMISAKEISHALESLTSLLRFSIKTTSDIIPFTEELEQLENYIQIMRVRYGDEVDVSFDIDDGCMEYQCLKFLFQPAVENCFIHAFARGADRRKVILIKASLEEDRIRAVVEDNGDGMGER